MEIKSINWINEKRKVSELIPAKYNPRKLSEIQKEQLKSSINKFSLCDPIIINKNNVVIGGHQRIKILKDIGTSECDVRVPDILLDDNQEKELNIRLNKNLGDWDNVLLKEFDENMLKDVGFDSVELDNIFKEDIIVGEDNVPEKRKETDIKIGDIFTLGDHRLMCGDSTDAGSVAILMNGNKADMVFTDPPYGVSYADKNKYLNSIAPGNRIQTEIENDHKSVSELQDTIIFPAFCLIKQFLNKEGSYYITAPQGGELLMMMMMMMQKAEIPLRHMLIWVKNNHVLGRTDYNYKHEPILYGWIEKHKFYGNGEFQFSTWEINKPTKSELHPTMKPVSLIVNAIQNSSVRESLVLDLFLGSGSTIIACEKTNRKCYGMEIDPVYCQVIIDRWENFTCQKAVKL